MTTPIYFYRDPNDSFYTTDRNTPGPTFNNPVSPVLNVNGYSTTTIDTTQLNQNLPPGDQQRNSEKFVHKDGTTVSPPPATTWVNLTNGSGQNWFEGSGAPSNVVGAGAGDFYYDTAGNVLYRLQ